jgi:hypothetical protein
VASDPTTLIPPTAGHTPFANATHRVYMSATLGGGGELERAFGVQRIARIPVPAAWQRHGAGRRLFLMPAAAADGGDDVLCAATAAVRRTLLIAPSQAASEEAASPVLPPDATRLGPDAIADGDVTSFLAPPRAALVLPNRYDGLDLPNEDCRLIVLSRLPTASHARERSLCDTLGARRVQRVRTRIAQGAGRETRNRQDFAAVALRGRDLIDFLLLRVVELPLSVVGGDGERPARRRGDGPPRRRASHPSQRRRARPEVGPALDGVPRDADGRARRSSTARRRVP